VLTLTWRRIRERGLHGQADPDAEEPVPGHSENGGAEEERGAALQQRQHTRGHQHGARHQHAQANGELLLQVLTAELTERHRILGRTEKRQRSSSINWIFSLTGATANLENQLGC